MASSNLYAAKVDSIVVEVSKRTIKLGSYVISTNTTIDQVMKQLGKPNRIEKLAGTDRYFIYDSLGIAFDIGRNADKKIDAFFVTFNQDKDTKKAKQKFTGVLMLDNYKITASTTSTNITDNTQIKQLNCFSTLCASMPDANSTTLTIGYSAEDRKKITQIGFGWKRK